MNPTKGLLISVGGTPDPIAFSLDHHLPEKVIFFASNESRGEIETRVRPVAKHRWLDQEVIAVDDPQDLVRCLEALAGALPEKLAALGLAASDLVVDYTGGTKTMSAALLLATIHEPMRYSYVGGTTRTKDGLGVVSSGAESMLFSPNPWEVLSTEYRRRVAQEFNAARFASAREIALDAKNRVGERRRALFVGLAELADAYRSLDAFEYAGIDRRVSTAANKVRQYASAADDAPLLEFLLAVDAGSDRLRMLSDAARALQGGTKPAPEALRAIAVDLVANADTAKRLHARPDDGVARLYSSLEKLAKAALLAHGIDTSAAAPEQIPESLRGEFVEKYGVENRLRFGLLASLELLDALGDPLGERYRAREVELKRVLETRNTSLMVHGWQAVGDTAFDRLFPIVLEFLEADEAALPRPPRLPE